MKTRSKLLNYTGLLAGALGSIVLMGCDLGATDGSENSTNNFGEMRDNVHVVDELMMEGALVNDDNLQFPVAGSAWLADVRVGDIVVSGVGLGYLRRVTEIVDDVTHTTLVTEQAHLGDALANAQLTHSLYSDADIEGFVIGDFAGFGIDRDISGTVLYAQNGLEVTIPEGFVSFKPSLDVDISVGLFKGVDFEFVANGQLDSKLVVQASASRSFSEAFSFRRTLFTSPTVRVPLKVGPVPLTLAITSYIDGNFQIGAAVSGSARAGAEVSAGVRAGIKYDGGFDHIGDANLTLTPIAPSYEVNGRLTATASLAPRIEVLILDSAGPTLGVEAYAQLAADANLGSGGAPAANCQVLAGLRGEVGGKLTIFNLIDIAEIHHELFDFNRAFGCLPQ